MIVSFKAHGVNGEKTIRNRAFISPSLLPSYVPNCFTPSYSRHTMTSRFTSNAIRLSLHVIELKAMHAFCDEQLSIAIATSTCKHHGYPLASAAGNKELPSTFRDNTWSDVA